MSKQGELKFAKAGNVINRGISFCIYGDPGVGKTTMATTLPADETLIINTEAGLGPTLGKNHVIFNLKNDLSDLDKLYQYLRTEKHPFKNVVIDNISELQEWILLKLTKIRTKEFCSRAEYGDAGFKMKETLHLFRDLIYQDINVVFNAWEATIDMLSTEGVAESKLYPKVFKSVAPELCGIVDVVGRLMVFEKTQKRWLRVAPMDKFVAKCQFEGLDEDEVADFGVIIKKLKEHNYGGSELGKAKL
jgi:phage nucleotide-binding protein